MTIHRRNFIRLIGIPPLSTLAGYAHAQDSASHYPSRAVHVLIGFPAGLAGDLMVRLVAQSLSEKLGQTFAVENRPGAGGNIAAEAAIRSPADGYTLFAISSANAVNATLYQGLSFDIVADTAAIAGTHRAPNVMVVTPSLPVETLPDFIAYAKAHPGQINYASAGYGTTNNIAGELFKQMTGVNLVHVPYKTSYLPDLLSGQVQVTFAPVAAFLSHIREGRLRALAVTGTSRMDVLPTVPTVADFVPGYELYIWGGCVAPKGTPPDIVAALNTQINASLAQAEVKEKLATMGAEPLVLSPGEFGKFIADEVKKLGAVVRAANIKAE
jgi:tripartite-type tricarboxylate transporter receptor subunit TctC